MELIDKDIEINEDFLPNSKLKYNIYFDGCITFEATLSENNAGAVGVDEAPKNLTYTMNKRLNEFSEDEISEILAYRGLKYAVDGFEPIDVFIEKTYLSLNENI